MQLYVWQEYDLAPEFPTLKGFLDYWERELEGALHSVRVAHHHLIRPSEWQAVDGLPFNSRRPIVATSATRPVADTP